MCIAASAKRFLKIAKQQRPRLYWWSPSGRRLWNVSFYHYVCSRDCASVYAHANQISQLFPMISQGGMVTVYLGIFTTYTQWCSGLKLGVSSSLGSSQFYRLSSFLGPSSFLWLFWFCAAIFNFRLVFIFRQHAASIYGFARQLVSQFNWLIFSQLVSSVNKIF